MPSEQPNYYADSGPDWRRRLTADSGCGYRWRTLLHTAEIVAYYRRGRLRSRLPHLDALLPLLGPVELLDREYVAPSRWRIELDVVPFTHRCGGSSGPSQPATKTRSVPNVRRPPSIVIAGNGVPNSRQRTNHEGALPGIFAAGTCVVGSTMPRSGSAFSITHPLKYGLSNA